MKIKTNYVPDNAKTYLTVGKEYSQVEGKFTSEDVFFIVDDDDDEILISISQCSHLDNRAWEVCDAE